MPTVSDALRARLADFPSLASLVSDRVFPAFVDEDEPAPYVMYLRIDSDEVEAMGENVDIQETTFEILSVGATYEQAEQIHEEVRAACRRFSGTAGGVEVTDMLLRGGEGPVLVEDPSLYEATQRVAVRYRRP